DSSAAGGSVVPLFAEAIAMAAPSVQFPGYRQAIGSGLMATLALAVWGGMNIVTKLGLFFALVVVYTLFSFYLGLFTVGSSDLTGPGSDLITGLSWIAGASGQVPG
ncbi:CCC1, partial [Symbiodinium sp. CCMP2456]